MPPSKVDVACHAPFTSMYLDQRGFVRACCQNDFHLLGNITERSLLDIWRGEPASRLRRAMEAHDLDLGCDFCSWQVDAGRPDLAFARWFDDLAIDGADPPWPRQLELSISNTCNLQCVMCDGEWSSSIRAQREGKPPIPKVYDDGFFAGLEPFLPHLEKVKFLGGEPFLAVETMRVMELLVEHGLAPRCHVTTNGTQWTPRVQRVLDMLPVDVAVSVDAATPATYESIRVGSSWDVLQRNLDRFQAHAEEHGRYLSLTYCLMVPNWHEFAAFCRMADARGLECAVNTVRHPHHLSLYSLDAAALAEVVEGLTADEVRVGHELTLSRPTWDAELQRLQAQLDDRRSGRIVASIDTWRPNPGSVRPFQGGGPDVPPASSGAAMETSVVVEPRSEAVMGPDRILAFVEDWVGAHADRLDLSDGRVCGSSPAAQVLGVPYAALDGRLESELADTFAASVGTLNRVEVVDADPQHTALRVHLDDGRVIRAASVPAVAAGELGPGRTIHLAWEDGERV